MPEAAPGSTAAGEPPRATAGADVVVVFGHTWWERAVARGRHRAEDRLITHLLESPRVRRLVVADNPRDWPVFLAKKLLGERTAPLPPRPGGRPATRFRPRRLLRRTARTERAADAAARTYSSALGAHARRAGLTAPHVICLNPVLAGFAPFEWAGSVTFFATDDWASHSQFRAERDVIERSYALVRERRRLVGAVSAEIIERVTAGRGEGGIVVPNGVEPADWVAPAALPAWTADLARPLSVYVGAIAEGRVDVDAVRDVVLATGGTVAVVGPVTDHATAEALAALPGVVVREPVPYADVPGLLSTADLSLLPHHDTPLTASMSPLKVYEALAAGVPVVATDLPPVRGIDGHVVLVAEGEPFGAAAVRALGLREGARADRVAFAARNAWSTRFDGLLDAVLSADASAGSAPSGR